MQACAGSDVNDRPRVVDWALIGDVVKTLTNWDRGPVPAA